MKSLGLTIFQREETACGTDTFNLPLGYGNVTAVMLDCPHTAGEQVGVEIKVDLGSDPPSKLACVLEAFDHNGEELMTVTIDVTP